MLRDINTAIASLIKRAESEAVESVTSSFIDIAGVLGIISSRESQIIYGRRGTGKTHALRYLAESLTRSGEAVAYLELSRLGSNQSAYGDPSLSLSERGSRLLVDTHLAIRERLLSYVGKSNIDSSLLVPALDELAQAVSEIRISGDVTVETSDSEAAQREAGSGITASLGPTPSIGGALSRGHATTSSHEQTTSTTGDAIRYVHFGRVETCIRNLVTQFPNKRLWVLLDEWTNVPQELQPLLADMLKRTLFAVPGVTVKIAAIENRTNWRIAAESGDYVGLHLGADVSVAVNLDELLVFGHEFDRSEAFFKELLFRHVQGTAASHAQASLFLAESPEGFVKTAFTSPTAFSEFTRAAERVPRDAMSIAGYAARHASSDKIGVKHVRSGARSYFENEKLAAIGASSRADKLLQWIMNQVLGRRKAKGFLVDQVEARSHSTFRFLYDERVLHFYQRSISSPDRPGKKFDAYVLDYGCYVHLADQRNSQLTLFADEEGAGTDAIQVPIDDYRSIRSAILRLSDFDYVV